MCSLCSAPWAWRACGWSGGLLLLILVRPRPRDFTRRDLRACVTLGVVTRPDDALHARDRAHPAGHGLLTFTLEYVSLRGLTAKAFGTLMSLEPAIAVLAGLLVLRQVPSPAAAIGVVFVVTAGIGAIRTGARAPALADHPLDAPRPPATAEPDGQSPT